jgi:pimeloyl-ACP methyl ester carboxylesterase
VVTQTIEPRRTDLTHVPLSTSELPPLDTTIPPWPGSHVEFDGHQVHVRTTPGPGPDAPTAVFVHGLGGSATNWTDLAGQLRRHVNGVALDLPGFGRSEPVAGYDFSLATHAGVVIRFIEEAGRGPVHLFGNSMGGAISLMVAATRPDLIRTLTLVSPAVPDLRPSFSRMSDPRLALAFMPVIGHSVRRKLALVTARERTEQMLQLCFGDPSLVPEHRIEESVRENDERFTQPWASHALGQSAIGLFKAWLAPRSKSMWTLGPLVTVPSLVVWGTHDRLVSVRKARRTAELLPKGRLLVLPGTGHVAQMERPITVARAVVGMWDATNRHAW